MNEGWATFWHYTIINTMYERGLVDNAFMVEFLHNHTDVNLQLPFDHPAYSGINPYTLGFSIYQDIRRICEKPTEEDREWFPDLAGKNWVDAVNFAMKNYKDESFIAQYLSPKLIRDLKLFAVFNDTESPELKVTDIHDEVGYSRIRDLLSKQYDISMTEPNIQVYNVDVRGDRSLTLRHVQKDNRPLEKKDAEEIMKHLYKIWGFNVKLESINDQSEVVYSWVCTKGNDPTD